MLIPMSQEIAQLPGDTTIDTFTPYKNCYEVELASKAEKSSLPESGRSLGAQKEGPSLPQGVGRGRVQKTPEQVRTAGSVASQAPH